MLKPKFPMSVVGVVVVGGGGVVFVWSPTFDAESKTAKNPNSLCLLWGGGGGEDGRGERCWGRERCSMLTMWDIWWDFRVNYKKFVHFSAIGFSECITDSLLWRLKKIYWPEQLLPSTSNMNPSKHRQVTADPVSTHWCWQGLLTAHLSVLSENQSNVKLIYNSSWTSFTTNM